jgi:ubiquinone/menaquinone biosynthesis C-methylase UbiE
MAVNGSDDALSLSAKRARDGDLSDLKTIYDEFARCYDEQRAVFNMDEIIAGFRSALGDRRGALLDLGCGAGVPFAQTFAARGWSVTGVDFSPEMLKLAQRHVPAMRTVQSDMRALRFPAASFDAVSIVYALFHIPSQDQFKLIADIYDWLRPGGRLLFTYATEEYSGRSEFDGYKEFMGRMLYYSHRAPAELYERLERIGFSSVDGQYRDIGGETFLWVTVAKEY